MTNNNIFNTIKTSLVDSISYDSNRTWGKYLNQAAPALITLMLVSGFVAISVNTPMVQYVTTAGKAIRAGRKPLDDLKDALVKLDITSRKLGSCEVNLDALSTKYQVQGNILKKSMELAESAKNAYTGMQIMNRELLNSYRSYINDTQQATVASFLLSYTAYQTYQPVLAKNVQEINAMAQIINNQQRQIHAYQRRERMATKLAERKANATVAGAKKAKMREKPISKAVVPRN